MGRYLSYLGNEKADLENNQFPDENYAREVMQLFTIGLWELNADGTFKLDKSGERIPTYNTQDIENGARVFTGFKLARKTEAASTRWDRFLLPMRLDEKLHDKDEKRFFNNRLVLKAGNSAEQDIELFLKALVTHTNTAPFISRRLIQQMTTSNPSPEYVQRVSDKWNETDGHLGEVVTAILLDPEAGSNNSGFGKLRDPLSRVVQVIKFVGCYQESEITSNRYCRAGVPDSR